MVIDETENILFYKPMIPVLEAGIMAVEAIERPEPRKCRFDGGYSNMQKGETKPVDEGTSEVHRRYIGVQILVKRHGEVAWADVGDLEAVIPYDGEKDVKRLSGGIKNRIRMDQGMFYIALLHDGYKPVPCTDEPHSFTKIVMEMPVLERVQVYSGGRNGGNHGKKA